MSFSNKDKLQMVNWIKLELAKALGAISHINTSSSKATSANLMHWSGGKLFEFYSFVYLLRELKQVNGHTLAVKNLDYRDVYWLNGGPGRLNPNYSHVEVSGRGVLATVWQNVEFRGLGSPNSAPFTAGDYHEADVLILDGGSPSVTKPFFPHADNILLAMECKFTADMPKAFLRNMLGLRRVMSYLSGPTSTPFGLCAGTNFKTKLPASRGDNKDVTSHLILAYSFAMSGKDISAVWANPAAMFGIEYWRL